MDSPAPFNNFRHPNDQKLSNLKDALGANSNFAIEVSERFTGTLDRGLRNVLGLPTTASQDMFFSDGIHIAQSGLVVSNLNTSKKYTFVFYGSRRDVGDNRETQYAVKGSNEGSALLDASNNTSDMAIVTGIKPAADGTITIVLSAGPNNDNGDRFYYINTLIIKHEGCVLPGM